MVGTVHVYFTLGNIIIAVLLLLLSLALSFDISGEKSMEAVLIISQPKAFVYQIESAQKILNIKHKIPPLFVFGSYSIPLNEVNSFLVGSNPSCTKAPGAKRNEYEVHFV